MRWRAPTISASGSRSCRAPAPIAYRKSTELSDALSKRDDLDECGK
jgi:hypothetical protein